MVVAGMAAYSDISKAHEIANEVRRVHKQLKDAQALAQTYNTRERLFGMPVSNVSSPNIFTSESGFRHFMDLDILIIFSFNPSPLQFSGY